MNETTGTQPSRWPGQLTRLVPGAELMEQQVESWFAEGLPMRWVPIIDAENFPGGMKDVHPFFGDFEASLIVSKPKDLMSIPNGMKGWLMPLIAADTDVACGRWDNAIYFLKVQDRRNGAVVTYQTEGLDDTGNPINATPPGAEGGKFEGDLK